jgi:fumarate reductase flavoprotein subunit
MKKVVKIGLVAGVLVTALIGLVGCSKGASSFSGEAIGHNGPVTVEVGYADGKITSVEVAEHQETVGIGDAAVKAVPASIVEHQSLGVDTITGATVTSKAILAAVEAALVKAGADVTALKQVAVAQGEGTDIFMETDVVVVGGGIAGTAAALEAANNGVTVILLEKLPFLGGSTIRSGGKILGAETPLQKKLGVQDSAEDFAQFLMETGEYQVNEEFINLIAHNSGENIQWLLDNGVELADELEPLHTLYRPELRGHFSANGSGAGFITPLEAKLKEKETVEILYSTPARELIEEGGRVVGVVAENDRGDTIRIQAKTVILATGGFPRNPEMVEKYFPAAGDFTTNAGEGNTGDGILMGMDVGADIVMPNAGIDLMLNPVTYHGYGEAATELFVTPEGKRFIDEREFHFRRTRVLYDYDVDHHWYIIDSKSYSDRIGAALEAGFAFKADSIAELAGEIEVDPGVLTATVERYNELCAAGTDADFGKPAEFMVPINEGPFYALTMRKSNSGTHGGLKITIDAQVLDTAGKIIPGLYAAGEVASGQILHREYPGSGTAILAFLTFGRQAGSAAAAEVK